jgi:hypothetical protein
MIATYFAQIEQAIETFPGIRGYVLQKKVYNTKQGYIRGQIEFAGGERLEFVEVKDTDVKHKLKYRYHCMDENHEMLFRYDNAPHHPEIASHPHHKHEENGVHESREPNLDDALMEIAEILRKSGTI